MTTAASEGGSAIGSLDERRRVHGSRLKAGTRAQWLARLLPETQPRSAPSPIVSFTACTSCFRLKGFGRNEKVSPSGRFFLKASSA